MLVGLGVGAAARLDVVGDAGDVDPDVEAVAVGFDPDGVVAVDRGRGVDHDPGLGWIVVDQLRSFEVQPQW